MTLKTIQEYAKMLLEAINELHTLGLAHKCIHSGNIVQQLGSYKLKLAGLGCKIVGRAD